MNVAGNQSQNLIFRPVYKKPYFVVFGGILCDRNGEILLIDGLFLFVDKGAYKFPLMHKVDAGGRTVLI